MGDSETVLAALEGRFQENLKELIALARIPSVSAAGFEPQQVERSAEAVADLLRSAGLEKVELLRVAGAHPYVFGEWTRAKGDAPTVLLYAHHDVQPPGRIERWRTPPFEPTVREDGRLYGRGVVDDKAGIVVQVAAVRAWLEARAALPVNVKLIVEGEEEIGSEHLAGFLHAHRQKLDCDVVVLSDTANLETGLPSITTSLRGLVCASLCVRALDHPLHSGMWGGPIPDAATALGVLLGRLVDAQGGIAIPGVLDDVAAPTSGERERLAALPFDEGRLRDQAGMVQTANFSGEADRSVYERLWLRPSLAVTALEAMPLAEAGNQLIAEARARVGIRLAPGQRAERVAELLTRFLKRDPPFGVEVEVTLETAVGGWRTEPSGPAFDAAARALRAGFGREPVWIGCGGTIPFVAPFAEELGGVPVLLLGLEDPVCNAHGENESLDLDDFRKAARAMTLLLEELGQSVQRS
ncbi:MAG: M20/M25/M40 family metallo-hydrolase [Myxococcota bacterium]